MRHHLLISFLLLASCSPPVHEQTTPAADSITLPASTAMAPPPVADTASPKDTLTPIVQRKEPQAQPPAVKPKSPAADTTAQHLYSHGKVSVRYTPWVNGARKVQLFAPDGRMTYEMEEVRQNSYSQSVQLEFAPNGAVAKARLGNHPGASRFWYDTHITFDPANEPLVMTSTEMPQVKLDGTKISNWDKDTRRWVRQGNPQTVLHNGR